MSKGLGANYLSDQMIGYYKRINKPFITTHGGQRLSMPRYYKEKIFTEADKLHQKNEIKQFLEENPTFKDDRSAFNYFKQQIEKRARLANLKRNNYE